jgi:hypothetical protein
MFSAGSGLSASKNLHDNDLKAAADDRFPPIAIAHEVSVAELRLG